MMVAQHDGDALASCAKEVNQNDAMYTARVDSQKNKAKRNATRVTCKLCLVPTRFQRTILSISPWLGADDEVFLSCAPNRCKCFSISTPEQPDLDLNPTDLRLANCACNLLSETS